MKMELLSQQSMRYMQLARIGLVACVVGNVGCVPVAVSTAAIAVGQVATDARSVRHQLDDQHIEFQLSSALRRAFIQANLVETSHVVLTVYQGVALLTGEVKMEAHRGLALKIVKDRGLARKIYNEIRVSSKVQPAQMARDAQITITAKAKLLRQVKDGTKLPKLITENTELFFLSPHLSKAQQARVVALMENIHGLSRIVFVDVS